MAPDQTSLQISNLTINTGYNVSVVAATGAGTGAAAIEIGRTDEDGKTLFPLNTHNVMQTFFTAPRQVTNLTIESMQLSMDPNNVTVVFSWTGPPPRNGPYTYTLIYSAVQDGDYPVLRMRSQAERTVTLSMTEDSRSIIGLPYANYTINMTAVNIKTGRAGPSSLLTEGTIIVGECIHTYCTVHAYQGQVSWGTSMALPLCLYII